MDRRARPCGAAAALWLGHADIRGALAQGQGRTFGRYHQDHRQGRQAASRPRAARSEEHTSELQSLMRISYAVFCLKKKNNNNKTFIITDNSSCTYNIQFLF